MRLEGFWHWLRVRQRLLAYLCGSAIVTVWTLLRFFTQRSIFDLVSQQVIVHQWLHGAMSIAHMGKSAYVPKMLLLYAPLDVLPGSPRLKLIILTVVVNVATLVLLGLVVEKILRELNVRITGAFYAALLLLSTIAGSVYWIEFANSRNLEVVGGVFWAYLGLRLLRAPSWKLAAGMAAFGGVLFFDDPLQVYMSALPVVLYGVALLVTKRIKWRPVARLCGVTALGYILAQLLFLAAGHYLHVTFTDTGGASAPALSPSWLAQSLAGTLRALIGMFAGGGDAGKLREVLDLSLLAGGVAAFVYTYVHKLIPRRLIVLLGAIVVTDIAVYIASGQALQGAVTARYLIMLAPVSVIALSTVRLPKRVRSYTVPVIGGVIAINAVLLGGALYRGWNTAFPQDAHLSSTLRYLETKPTVHLYADIDTAMALQYYSKLPADSSLPLGCLNNSLVRTHFSMDKAFDAGRANTGAVAAILFDGATITNTPNVCTPSGTMQQLGTPLGEDHTDDGSVVLLYKQAAIHLPD